MLRDDCNAEMCNEKERKADLNLTKIGIALGDPRFDFILINEYCGCTRIESIKTARANAT